MKVPKLRTGSGSQSGLTAATCKVAPMSIAAAWACTGDIARVRRESLVVATEPSFDVRQRRGWAARQINFLTGIVLKGRHHSQVRSSPRAMFENGVLDHQKADGRSSPAPTIMPTVSSVTGGAQSRASFLRNSFGGRSGTRYLQQVTKGLRPALEVG